MDILEKDHLKFHPLRGSIFENLVVLEIKKNFFNSGRQANIYYYRDNNNNEVDILMKRGDRFIPIEIKSSETYNKQFLKGINNFKKNNKISNAYLIYAGIESSDLVNEVSIKNYKNTADLDIY